MANTVSNKLYIFEKALFIIVLGFCLWGFWYFEESFLLRVIAVVLVVASSYLVIKKKPTEIVLPNKLELGALTILYLGTYTLYNLLYGLNLPLYIIMLSVLILVMALCYSLLTLDQFDTVLGKEIFRTFVVLMGVVTLEIFLCLYFWPIGPEIKSLIIVVVFYLMMSLIYLYIHGMLRLKRIVGYLVVCFLILGILLVNIWLQIAR